MILFLSVGAILLFSVSLLLPVFLFISFCWSKYSVFQLFPQSSLLLSSSRWGKYSVFQLFPQSSLLLSSSCWSKYSVFQLFPQFSLLLPSARWSKYSFFQLFAPIQFQSSPNPASIQPQINLRLRSDHPRSGLSSASSVYRWIHTLQVRKAQIQSPHR